MEESVQTAAVCAAAVSGAQYGDSTYNCHTLVSAVRRGFLVQWVVRCTSRLMGVGMLRGRPWLKGVLWLGLCCGLPGVEAGELRSSGAAGAGLVPAVAWDDGQAARLLRVSDKAREIADRLERSGYYRRLSRAYRGYPHLRSKRSQRLGGASSTFVPGYDAAARLALRSNLVAIARAEKLDPDLLDAVIVVESGYNAQAVSPKGAQGLMQLMPGTAERFGVSDAFDPAENIRGGARYLRWLMGRFDGNLELVLAAYNAGEGAVAAYSNRIPPYPETQRYVRRVLKLYRDDG